MVLEMSFFNEVAYLIIKYHHRAMLNYVFHQGATFIDEHDENMSFIIPSVPMLSFYSVKLKFVYILYILDSIECPII